MSAAPLRPSPAASFPGKLLITLMAWAISCTPASRSVDRGAVVRDAAAALAAWDDRLFDITGLRVGKVSLVALRDLFWHETWLCLAQVEATVTPRRAVVARDPQQLLVDFARRGSQLTTAEVEHEHNRARVMGPGLHPAGVARPWSGTVVFEHTGSGCRFLELAEPIELEEAILTETIP